ncbi:MAG: SpoIIE family protein phosphatase [Ignavibacteriae bacterium]|nr:SpoIIE family protein phosphatase [Ignavibacteriota bacterium]
MKPLFTGDRLRHNILFENITDDEFEILMPKLQKKRCSVGDIIVEDESEGEELYLVAEGRVKIVKITKSGEEKLLALLHAGDFFGELELVDCRPRSARVVAVDECTLYVLRKDDFDRLLQESQPFAIRLMQVLSIRLRASNNHFISELERSTQRSLSEVKKLERLIEAAKIVNSTLDLDRLLKIILDTALKIVDGDRGTVYVVDEQKQELWSKVLEGSQRVKIRLPIGKGIAGYVAATGDTLNIPDAYLDPRFNPDVDKKTGYRTKTILCMPMRTKEGRIIGVLQLLNKQKGIFTQDDESFIAALSVHAAIAIENARLYEEEKTLHRMREEVRLAAEIQLNLLPKTVPTLTGYDLAGTSIPAQIVGGDYFDFIPINSQQWAICIGDVSGKGLPASLLMANLQATLRGQTLLSSSPKDCILRSNKLLYHSTRDDKFVTLFYGILDIQNHQFRFCNAGHDNPFFFPLQGNVSRLRTGGIVLGILEHFPFEESMITFQPGDLLVMYSDGISEAMNDKQELFSEESLAEVASHCHHSTAAEIIDAVIARAKKHMGRAPQADDMTLMVVKRNPS